MERSVGKLGRVGAEGRGGIEGLKLVLLALNSVAVPNHIQYDINGSNPDVSFTVDDSNSFFSRYKILPISQENKYLGIFFLFYHGIVCWVYSLESPHRGDSNVYTQHTITV